jgi:uncharacterized protein YjiK
MRNSLLLLAIVLAPAACRSAADSEAAVVEAPEAVARETKLMQALADSARTDTAPVAQWVLPAMLAEVSGLAVKGDGRLLAHGDERGVVYELDYRRGVLVRQFMLGDKPIMDDFEGITIANGVAYLVTSKGDVYEFREGGDGAKVDFRRHDLKLGKECEFEGVAYDPALNSLLLACKNVEEQHGDVVLIYRWKLDASGDGRLTSLSVPLATAIGSNEWKQLRPSDITVDPATGNYVLISSQDMALLELTPAGAVVSSRPLPSGHHQPEGVAITDDRALIVSDEAGDQRPLITVYRWPLASR